MAPEPEANGERRQLWHAYFNVHGDPFVVADPERANTTVIATVATSPDDYGRGNALLMADAPAMAHALQTIYDQHSEAISEPGWCNTCAFSWPCWHRTVIEPFLSHFGGSGA